MISELTHLWTCDKNIIRIGIPTERKWTNEKGRILSKILWFSRQEYIQNIKIFECYTEKMDGWMFELFIDAQPQKGI